MKKFSAIIFYLTIFTALFSAEIVEIDGKKYIRNENQELREVEIIEKKNGVADEKNLQRPARGGKYGMPHKASWALKENAAKAEEIKNTAKTESVNEAEVKTATPVVKEQKKSETNLADVKAKTYKVRVLYMENGRLKASNILRIKNGGNAQAHYTGVFEYSCDDDMKSKLLEQKSGANIIEAFANYSVEAKPIKDACKVVRVPSGISMKISDFYVSGKGASLNVEIDCSFPNVNLPYDKPKTISVKRKDISAALMQKTCLSTLDSLSVSLVDGVEIREKTNAEILIEILPQ